jgi:hypothetical protein
MASAPKELFGLDTHKNSSHAIHIRHSKHHAMVHAEEEKDAELIVFALVVLTLSMSIVLVVRSVRFASSDYLLPRTQTRHWSHYTPSKM